MIRLDLPSPLATEALGQRLAAALRPGDNVLLAGAYGAGKSALARAAIRAALGDATAEVPSPSFSLLQSYEAPGLTLHHLDLWRLPGPEALAELGLEDLAGGASLIEWPQRLGGASPPGALHIALSIVTESARQALLWGWPQARLAALAAGADSAA